MSEKMDEAALRKKNRSLETMLSRTRIERDAILKIATDAVTSVKESNNGQVKEAAEALGRALKRTEELVAVIGKSPVGEGA